MNRENYTPSAQTNAHIEKTGDNWALVIARDLRHSPDKVWEAITDPDEIREWAPFDADGNLGKEGNAVKLTTVGAPMLHVTETTITKAEPPHLLEYNWGGFDMRWTLEPSKDGTRLTLWTNIDRRFIAMGAAGWHLCFDVLDHYLDGDPLGRIVGPDAMAFDGWHQLHNRYKTQFAEDK
jgi:uncharacterized protein YndB with AHSA1/START domain